MIKALNHICIDIIDIEETERFYCQQLGLSLQYDYIRQGERFGLMIKIDEQSYIEAFCLTDEPLREAKGIKHMCFTVDDIDECERVLTERGVACRNKKQASDGSWALWCEDPNGISIEFNAFDEHSSIYTGADRIITW